MRNRLSLTIPSQQIGFDLKALIATAAQIAGGATVVEARGLWYDGDGREYKEHVLVHHFWYDTKKERDLNHAANDIIVYLHGQGEKSVLVESIQYTDAGTLHGVLLFEQGEQLDLSL